MSSYLRLTKVWPRYEALQRRSSPLATSSRFCGAPVCDEPPTIGSADRRSSRFMSVNTRGASAARSGKKAVESGEDDDEEKHHTASSFKSSEEVKANQSQRETYEEKQSDTHVDFARIREAPAPSAEQWWYPDPFTGHFVPRDNYGEISTNIVLKEGKHIPLSTEKPLKKPPAPAPAFKKLGGVPTKGEKGGWWTSMEELPDLDECHMRC
ncbi:hypothetical protein Mapa_000875 [Marchantia paleacea]|nr:hypothetical protein Mapa_000875 [Marchantia paleacea]